MTSKTKTAWTAVATVAGIVGIGGLVYSSWQQEQENDAVRHCVGQMTIAGTLTSNSEQMCRDWLKRIKQFSN